MKKLFLTLIAAIAFCGSVMAQQTHWPEFNYHDYENNDGIVAFIQIDGNFIERTDDYQNYEVGAFIDDVIRGHAFLVDYFEDYGDPHPIIELAVYYDPNEGGTPVSFKLYNHATGETLENCTSNIEILTGEDHLEEYDGPEYSVVLNFAGGYEPPVLINVELPIVGYQNYEEVNGGWNLISVPVYGMTPAGEPTGILPADVDGMINDNYDLYAFDQMSAGAEWRNYKAGSFDMLECGQGYLYASYEDNVLVFEGYQYEGDGSVQLYSGVGAAAELPLAGWNLVGNPWMEAAYVNRNFYVMNEDGSDFEVADDLWVIPMQGIFVYTEEDETMYFETEAVPGSGAKLVLNLNKDNKFVDRAIVNLGKESTLPKLQLNSSHTSLYIEQDSKEYAVYYSELTGEMPVSFKPAESGMYTLSVNLQGIELGYLHMIDNVTGDDIDLLANPSYTFSVVSDDTAVRSRFVLVFAETTGLAENFGFMNNGNLIVSGEGTLQVIDLMGRVLSSEQISGSKSINMNVAPGVYMIRLSNGNDTKTQKIVVE